MPVLLTYLFKEPLHFRLTFKELEPQHELEPSARDVSIIVEPHVIPSRGPYPHVEPRKNTIQFTPAQVFVTVSWT